MHQVDALESGWRSLTQRPEMVSCLGLQYSPVCSSMSLGIQSPHLGTLFLCHFDARPCRCSCSGKVQRVLD